MIGRPLYNLRMICHVVWRLFCGPQPSACCADVERQVGVRECVCARETPNKASQEEMGTHVFYYTRVLGYHSLAIVT